MTDYAQAAQNLAEEMGVPFIALHRISEKHHNEIGPEASLTYNATAEDSTHFSPKGAEAIADLIVAELKKTSPDLASYLLRPVVSK